MATIEDSVLIWRFKCGSREALRRIYEKCRTDLLRIYVLAMRLESQSNALRTALEVYLTKGRTGEIPEILPTSAPEDPFSDEAFKYTRTTTGFVLRCRGKDLDRDEAHEYEFIVKK